MKHILLIDDEAQIREILREVLGRGGYRVTDVESAAKAIETVRRDPPQLVITDLQLEDSDGFELIDQLRELAPRIPVMLLTGVLFDADMTQRLGEKNITAYLEKTASLERVLKEVRRLLGEK